MLIRFYTFAIIVFISSTVAFLFYSWAYRKGYEKHTYETENKIIQCVIESRQDIIKAGNAVQRVQEKIEKRKTKDEICRDILNFDIRNCL